MGLFDRFKKQDCEICGKEVGMFGYKKLEDGEICKDCVKLLSPWFEDRRHATVQQIKEQLAYREQNAQALKSFQVTRTYGDSCGRIHIEEVNGVPTRFFVTTYGATIESNPDIISFQDVISCVTDIDVRDEEMKQKNSEGQMVSYNPPRFKHHHNFIIRMEIRNNPYFDDIHFTVNSGVVTLETVGGVGGGLGGAAMSGLLKGVGVSPRGMQTDSYKNSAERRRYEEYRMMCEKIEQAVEDGKRGAAAPAAQTAGVESILMLIGQIHNAPDLLTALTIASEVARQATTLPDHDWERVKTLNDMAVADAKLRLGHLERGNPPGQEAPKPKFCPNCGAPADSGKFCQSCGSKL